VTCHEFLEHIFYFGTTQGLRVFAKLVCDTAVLGKEFVRYFYWQLAILRLLKFISPIPVTSQPKALVCSYSPAEIVGSNPTGGA
jgi:hypothetical protein